MDVHSIIGKYNADEDNSFSNEDVLNIANEIKTMERKSLFNNKLLIAAFALIAVVSAADRGIARISGVEIVSGEESLPPIRHLQEAPASYFADWIQCEAVATIPRWYLGEGVMDPYGTTYMCKSTNGCNEPNNHFPSAHPTPTQTPAPTVHPIVSPTDPPTVSPEANTGADQCVNILNFGYKGDPEHACEWVQRTDFRRNLLCTKMRDVREACPVSCGICCEDNPNFLTDTPYGAQGCDWIGANPLRKIGYCPVPDVGTFCARTCDRCLDSVLTMVPSMFGTSNETSAPTGRLDDD